jgi:hypothetical protein
MGKTPKSPDPYAVANAQAGANLTAAQQNIAMGNANQITPYGSQTWDQSGWQTVYDSKGNATYVPRYTSTIKLSPEEEALRQQSNVARSNLGSLAVSQSAGLRDQLGRPLDTSSFQQWQAAQAPGQVRQDQTPTDRAAVEKAMMERYNQDAGRTNAAQQTQAINRGMAPGSQGYGTMQEGQDRARTDALSQAYLASGEESRAAQQAYNQAGQLQYQMGADWASQLNNLRQAQQTAAIQLRDQPLKEYATMSGLSAPNTPTFSPWQGSSTSAPNIGQYIYDDYNARSQAASNNMSGIFGIGAAAAKALPWASILAPSDRRLKRNIKRLGNRQLAGVPLYSFVYRDHAVVPPSLRGTRHIGVMADEVRPIHPDAVLRPSDGYDRVNYTLLNMRHDNG